MSIDAREFGILEGTVKAELERANRHDNHHLEERRELNEKLDGMATGFTTQIGTMGATILATFTQEMKPFHEHIKRCDDRDLRDESEKTARALEEEKNRRINLQWFGKLGFDVLKLVVAVALTLGGYKAVTGG